MQILFLPRFMTQCGWWDWFYFGTDQNQLLFQVAPEIDSTRVQTLLHCFASTFEEVKVLAFELLMKLRPSLPYFQV